MSYTSRIPRITAELAVRADAAAKAGAERVEREAKSRVPVSTGRLRDAIHTERDRAGEYKVLAGSGEVFYGHILEHGGVHTPPRPFMVPAAEAVRSELEQIGRAIMRGLG